MKFFRKLGFGYIRLVGLLCLAAASTNETAKELENDALETDLQKLTITSSRNASVDNRQRGASYTNTSNTSYCALDNRKCHIEPDEDLSGSENPSLKIVQISADGADGESFC